MNKSTEFVNSIGVLASKWCCYLFSEERRIIKGLDADE